MAGKRFKTALCAAFAVSLMVLASCGGKEGEDSAVKPPSEAQTKETDVETTAEETKGAQTSDASGKKFATVADFANSEEVQTQLELQKKSLDGSSMDIAITGEGNRLIYTLTYLELENGDGMAEELQQDARRKIIVGDGGKLCADALTAAGVACRLAPPYLVMQSAVTVALEAEEAAGRGGLVSAQELAPVYLRPPQAERLRARGADRP